MMLSHGMAGGKIVVPIEFVAASTATSSISPTITVNKPAGVIEGDLMIAVMACSGKSWTGDTGWTEVYDQTAGNGMRIAYKFASASEGSSYGFTYGGFSSARAVIAAYRYAVYDTVGSIDTAATCVAPSISVAAGGSQLLAIYTNASATLPAAPSGMGSVVSISGGTGFPAISVFSELVAAGATGPRTATLTGSAYAGCLLSINPK